MYVKNDKFIEVKQSLYKILEKGIIFRLYLGLDIVKGAFLIEPLSVLP